MGMNAAELDKNAALTERVVQDLNLVPTLPFMDASFDFVLCVVSVDYLVQPRDVLRDALRALRPGGEAVISFSNRFFPPKVRDCSPTPARPFFNSCQPPFLLAAFAAGTSSQHVPACKAFANGRITGALLVWSVSCPSCQH